MAKRVDDGPKAGRFKSCYCRDDDLKPAVRFPNTVKPPIMEVYLGRKL